MRLTIRINGSSPSTQQSFAVLWLDTEEQLWSREAHQGINLPTWGKVKDVEGAIALCAADSGEALCQLQGLSFEKVGPTVDAGHGDVVLGDKRYAEGAWRLQAVDACSLQPETRGFTVVR
ncbi:DUF3564 family protein [Burkholderia alba]|uniref:DUF3564 family protein n=1 Tax=Burkholderia alba TaxID=2683677 RepID=UPI002B0540D1|nr:DUF3564 family protein [Burkholderia alba]